MRRASSLAALLLTFALAGWAAAAEEPSAREVRRVLKVNFKGVIGVVMSSYLSEAIAEAERGGYDAVLLEIDTPGGLVSSTREMVSAIMNSKVPVIAWVAPAGSRAASAGSFVVMASHVAAMAEGTHIGAAHPVTAGGGDIEQKEMNRKITNDLASLMRSLAETRGRNARVAEGMVYESKSFTAKEALEANLVDLVASSAESLMAALDGREVALGQDRVAFRVQDPSAVEFAEHRMSARERALEVISRPDVAYLLLIAGIYALAFEFFTPGFGVTGITGVILILAGAYGLQMLPVNYAGIALLLVGMAALLADLHFGSIILSIAGVLAMMLGGIITFRTPGGELLRQSMQALIGGVLAISLLFLLAVGAVLKTMKRPPKTGAEGLVGAVAKVMSRVDAVGGTVSCHGEIWRARLSGQGSLEEGSSARVVAVEGLTLVVEPCDKDES